MSAFPISMHNWTAKLSQPENASPEQRQHPHSKTLRLAAKLEQTNTSDRVRADAPWKTSIPMSVST